MTSVAVKAENVAVTTEMGRTSENCIFKTVYKTCTENGQKNSSLLLFRKC